MFQPNINAIEIVKDLIRKQDIAGVHYYQDKSNAHILDCGIKVKPGFLAGIYMNQACMGGLGYSSITLEPFAGHATPHITAYSDHPAIGMMASQTIWPIESSPPDLGIITGPGKFHAKEPASILAAINYEENSNEGVFILQMDHLPSTETIQQLGKQANLNPENMYFLIAPMSAISSAIRICGSSVEVVMIKMWNLLHISPLKVKYAIGKCPLPPFTHSSTPKWTPDDMLVYGGQVHLYLESVDASTLPRIGEALIPHTSRIYGRPFRELFAGDDKKLSSIDPTIFSAGEITLTDLSTGETITRGHQNPQIFSQTTK